VTESSTAEIVPKGYKENPDMFPIPKEKRTIGYFSFSFMMFSMNTCIPMFFLGPIAKTLGLNIWQAIIGAFLGNLAAVIVMALNALPGVKYGINFPVQLRQSFGFKGIHIPIWMRGISGLMWFGIEAYAGSLAITMIILYSLGVPPNQVTPLAVKWVVPVLLFYLGTLVLVMSRGLKKGIAWMANWAGPLMFAYFIWLALWLAMNPHFAPNMPKIFVSTAGYLSVNFAIYLAVQTNWWATVALNISDLSRGVKKWGIVWVALILGVVVGQIAGTALGFILSVLTQEVLPQTIIVKYAPGVIAVIVGLIFTFLAPWSTDLTANAPAFVDILLTTFKLRWKWAVFAAAVVAFFAAPWWAVEKGPQYINYVTAWASNYGILLGPIVGPMIGSFWIFSKRKLNLQKLYTYGPEGYWYKGGFGLAALLSVFVTIAICYGVSFAYPKYLLSYAGGVPFPGGPVWYLAVIISLALYLIFAKWLKEIPL